MQDQWYYQCAGQQAGPVSTDGLRQLVGAGQLGDADEVWRVGTPDWLPVRQVPEVADLLSRRPAAAGYGGLPTAEPSFANLAQITRWLAAGPAVVLRHSKLSAAGSMLISAFLLALGGWLLGGTGPKNLPPFLFGVFLAGLGVLGLFGNLAVLLDSRPQLVLDSAGLSGPRRRLPRSVRWEEIEKANLSQLLRNGAVTSAVITLTVRNAFGLAEQVEVDVFRLTWDPQRIFREIGLRAGLVERPSV